MPDPPPGELVPWLVEVWRSVAVVAALAPLLRALHRTATVPAPTTAP